MNGRTDCLERAGHILIMINWIQGRLVDFIIFKNHPGALKYFIKHNSSPTLGRERRKYWQKSFSVIRKEFAQLFPNLPSNWLPLLDDLNHKRDMIAHGHLSLYTEYILYQPDMNRRDIKGKLKSIRRAIDGKISKKTFFKLKFDDQNYKAMVDGVLEFDEKLFPALSKEMGFNYERIR
jgi:hypothetical protein